MPEKLRRPTPYTPLGVTFATGKTGTMLLTEFGVEGLGVWAAMLAAAKAEEGLIVFRHDADWSAIGLALRPPGLELKTLLRRLGQIKQTKTTRQGQLLYVELTRWEDWNKMKERSESAWRMSRKRGTSSRNHKRNANRTPTEQEANANRDSRAREDIELDVEIENRGGGSSGPTLTSAPEDDNDEDLVTYEEWQVLERQRERTEEAHRRGQVEA